MLLLLQNRLRSALRAGVAFPLPTSFVLRHRLFCTEFVSEGHLKSSPPVTSRPRKLSKPRDPSPTSPVTTLDRTDAIRTFLASELGISTKSGVASAIVRSARRLGCDVDKTKTLAPCVSKLRDIGLSTLEIARLLPLVPSVLVSPERVTRLAFYISFVGSFDKVLSAIRMNRSLLATSVEDVVKPNIASLLQCGLTAREIAQVFVYIPRLFTKTQEHVEDILLRAEQLGVPRDAPMFRYAVVAAYAVRRESIVPRVELLKSFGMSSGQVAMAVVKLPCVLSSSEDRLRRAMEFLTKEVGMDMEAIAGRPSALKYSIEGRLAPRLKVLKLLEENGLPAGKADFYNAASLSNEQFLKKFVRPHEKSVPGLAAVYAAARSAKGKATTGADIVGVGGEM